MTELISFTIAADPPPRLDKALSRDAPAEAELSRSRIVKLLAEGAVRVNGEVVSAPKTRVTEGAHIEIGLPDPAPSHIVPQDITLDIVFEDDSLVVVNKAPGMVVHPAPGTPDGTLVNALLHHFGAGLSDLGGDTRPGIVHRIDKDTSGLLVVAKTDAAHQALAKQFEAHSVERLYKAVANGVPDANDPRLRGIRGTRFEAGNILQISTFLARHKTDRQKQAVYFDKGRHAVTRVRTDAQFGKSPAVALVSCWLETGRTHQIRVHLAHVGHGLVGDPVYGSKRRFAKGVLSDAALQAISAFPRQALHAAHLGFEHPKSGEMLRFEAPLPSDMAELVEVLQTSS
ncbi:MAG: RluA family pseudouridine synthase [Pseudomonadota bacterium]